MSPPACSGQLVRTTRTGHPDNRTGQAPLIRGLSVRVPVRDQENSPNSLHPPTCNDPAVTAVAAIRAAARLITSSCVMASRIRTSAASILWIVDGRENTRNRLISLALSSVGALVVETFVSGRARFEAGFIG